MTTLVVEDATRGPAKVRVLPLVLSQDIVLESIEEVTVQLSWYEVELVAMKGPGHHPRTGHSQGNDNERGSSIDNARGSGRDDTRSKAKETLLLRARYLY
jgi:hypothetical protein